MRYLYYCATPFQVLNAMNMHFQRVIYKSTEDVHADIVIEEQFRDAQLLIDALKKESVFERVFHLKKEDRKAQKNNRWKLVGIGLDMIFPRWLLHRQIVEGSAKDLCRNYDYVIASVLPHTVSNLRTINPNSELIMMDDGVGSYFGDIVHKNRSAQYLILLSLIRSITTRAVGRMQ